MKFDFSKLKGRIREKGVTQDAVAAAIGISKCTFSLKINGNTYFTQEEIFLIAEFLDIPKEQYNEYFFIEKV